MTLLERIPEEQRRTSPCPECSTVLRRETRGPCAVCGAYLIPTEGMPDARPSRKAYKQDEDGSWRLVLDPANPPPRR